ncbi:hypothetical protein THIOKS12670037 [Thiocapsa sp. KS1]|nr:hypothetical protein THIOKS12670037 [Thiocapsa sp. KS1]
MKFNCFIETKPRRLQRSSRLPEPIPSKNIAYRAGRGSTEINEWLGFTISVPALQCFLSLS